MWLSDLFNDVSKQGKEKCSYCGFENSCYNTECEKCGATLEETNNKTVVDSRNETIVTSANVEVKKKKVVDGLVILLFFLMYPVAIWLIARRKNELDSDWFTIVSLILFYPMGLFSMWYYKKFNKTARIVITVIIAVLMIGTQLGQ